VQQALPGCQTRRVSAVHGVKFTQNVAYMAFCGVQADGKLIENFLIGSARSDQI
jgi:hypothetical protein